MDQIIPPTSLKRYAPWIGCAAGAAVALLVAVMPEWRLEALVSASGVADAVAAARAPLGATARSALALMSGGVIAAFVFAVLTFAPVRRRGPAAGKDDPAAPILRRADAHPDAPARRPLRASEDLGDPRPIGAVEAPATVPAEGVGERVNPRPLPADLDTPLAAVDPGAIPAVPREPVRAVAPLSRPALVDANDRMETFELTPIRRAIRDPAAHEGSGQPSSLAALLDRLELGAARRATPATRSLEETLGLLRGLAAR